MSRRKARSPSWKSGLPQRTSSAGYAPQRTCGFCRSWSCLLNHLRSVFSKLPERREWRGSMRPENWHLTRKDEKAQRLERIGTSTRDIGHEFNNVLNSIWMSAKLLQMGRPRDDTQHL